MLHPKLEIKIADIKKVFRKSKFLIGILPVVTGSLSLIWFLVRVIPKPQRASYPCMKVAYPLMTGLVIWICGITGISASIHLFMNTMRNKKYLLTLGAAVMITGILISLSLYHSEPLSANTKLLLPIHPANVPVGVSQGVIPGRVVWTWNPDATNENCTNDLARNDGYFLAANNNQEVIDKMLAVSILKVANAKSQKKAWNAIFRYFNKQKNRSTGGYVDTETVFIKINQGCANWSTISDLTRRKGSLGYAETSPQIIIAVLKQLINVAGVPQNKIIVADPMAHIYEDNYKLLHKEFPDVKYGDKSQAASAFGRTFLTPETAPVLFYSDNGTVLSKRSDCLYSEMQNADYLINISALKAHACAGVTFCAKNHFGSITAKSAGQFHAGLVGSRNDKPTRIDYGMYRIQVDLMGSKYLGRNTLIGIVDGLWGGTEATETPIKWKMAPFNDDWPNSIFVSQDQVALESVCFDFVRNEATVGSPEWNNRPNMAQGVDDYLHQAASSEFWPQGIIYDPDKSGTKIPSLGIHEHWNNPVDKNYSINLGKKYGIELVRILQN